MVKIALFTGLAITSGLLISTSNFCMNTNPGYELDFGNPANGCMDHHQESQNTTPKSPQPYNIDLKPILDYIFEHSTVIKQDLDNLITELVKNPKNNDLIYASRLYSHYEKIGAIGIKVALGLDSTINTGNIFDLVLTYAKKYNPVLYTAMTYTALTFNSIPLTNQFCDCTVTTRT